MKVTLCRLAVPARARWLMAVLLLGVLQGCSGAEGESGVGAEDDSGPVDGAGGGGGGGEEVQCTVRNFCSFESFCEGTDVRACVLGDCWEGQTCAGAPCEGVDSVETFRLCEGRCVGTELTVSSQDDRYGDPVTSFRRFDNARCVPEDQACGGPGAQPCAAGHVCTSVPHAGVNGCDFLAGGGYGVCVAVTDCDEEPSEALPHCGCDGAAYPTLCAVAEAGVAVEPARRDRWNPAIRSLVPPSSCEARALADGDPTGQPPGE